MVRISRFATSPRLTSSSSSGNWEATWSPGEYVFRRSMNFCRRSVTLGGAGDVNPGRAQAWTQKKQKKRNLVAGVDQEELFDPESLADPDSLFFNFKGVHIHYKEHIEKDEQISSSSSLKVKYPFVLLHGFGASSFSWKLAMGPLSRLTFSKVLAFDRPAFGLTSRIISSSRRGGCEGDDDIAMRMLNPYSMGFSVRSTLSFIDHLSAEKAILIG
ncbi:hypothetical protein QJS04_geneDACA016963 [Acorus gramineus]|uniref:AB hydrolase-1 domain-containing protein n=1 Tax=Acorus gramineus TaxID=55184 RepID=A0AAV9AJC7_ACOGR|nr:hypothetical protein QJS04_geneDACA016963 [Acorus gramineus]